MKAKIFLFFIWFYLLAISFEAIAAQNPYLHYGLVRKNLCKTTFKNLEILYDGYNVLQEENFDLRPGSFGHYFIPMIVPEIATISWKDAKNKKHVEKIPLRKLTGKIRGDFTRYKILYDFCSNHLTITLSKNIGNFQEQTRELWDSRKAHPKEVARK